MVLAIVVYTEWILCSSFGPSVAQSCLLSLLTNIYIDLQLSQTHSFNISPEPDYSVKQSTTTIVVYDLHNEKQKGITFSMSCN
ncbi:unnamed protein product [Rotaria sp. Silwood2]|nr:unnamed protein product [Rotaria sp. Silwood2]